MQLGTVSMTVMGIGLVLSLGVSARQDATADVKLTVDHNFVMKATPEFKFPKVASPMKDDAAAKAVVKLVDGEIDPNGAALNALVDGLWPRDEDEPGANFFFDAGTAGGRFRMDLGSVIDIAEVRTYSWHPNTRGPQVYTLYASNGTDPKFNLSPRNDVDPATAGWSLIARVDTRTREDPGGQDAVSIKRTTGSLGTYRHLLFVCFATEADDDWGNTFYSEIDVIAASGGSPGLKTRGSIGIPGSHAEIAEGRDEARRP